MREALENLQRYARIIQYRFNGKHRVEVEASWRSIWSKFPKMLLPAVGGKCSAPRPGNEGGRGCGARCRESGTEQKIVAVVKDNGQGLSGGDVCTAAPGHGMLRQEGTIPDDGHGIGFPECIQKAAAAFTGRRLNLRWKAGPGKRTEITMVLPEAGGR